MGSFRNVTPRPERLNQPASVKSPKRIFVADVSDLFHELIVFEFILEVFNVMRTIAPWHTYQVLTKRIRRVIDFTIWYRKNFGKDFEWPENVWLGTSCEDQAAANDRIPVLMVIDAKVKFLSCEPLVGPIDLSRINPVAMIENGETRIGMYDDCLNGIYYSSGGARLSLPERYKISWVIAGGESGPNAEPMHPDWVRSLRDQCAAAKVPFFFKQWGEFIPFEPDAQPPFYFSSANPNKCYDGHGMNHIDPETGEAGRWMGGRWYDPMDAITLCLETKSSECTWLRLGKHKTGNKLDGKQHLNFPVTPLRSRMTNVEVVVKKGDQEVMRFPGAFEGDQGPIIGGSY